MNNEILPFLISIFLLVSIGGFYFYRHKALLLFLQQEEYDNKRFLNWVWQKRAFDKRCFLLFFIGVFLIENNYLGDGGTNTETGFSPALYAIIILFCMAFIWGIFQSRTTLKHNKKPLVMTKRAKRIFWLSLVLGAAGFWLATEFGSGNWLMLIFIQMPPLFLTLANSLLKPFENSINNKFLNEAKAKLKQLNPTVIAITGSYGKTSTKYILSHILSASAPTLATPGSVNTQMGITRIIRENLEKKHKYFIAEMGAYGEGSIARLCELCPPDMGLITSIGQAHLERFGSIESVFKAKFELATAVAQKNGVTFINASRMPPELLREKLSNQDQKFEILTIDDSAINCDFTLKDPTIDANGISFTLVEAHEKTAHPIQAPVFGKHHCENIALAIMAARQCGMPMDTIKAALMNLPQTRHRLELFKSANEPWVLDDAYNSNPSGFCEALQTLSVLVKAQPKGARGFLITPGMVEMGDAHESAHYELGKLAGQLVDVAAIVTPERIASFIKGFSETSTTTAQIKTFATQDEAQNWVKSLARSGDIILYENNLPDLFESEVRF